MGGAVLVLFAPASNTDRRWRSAAVLAASTVAVAALAQGLDLWRWRVVGFDGGGKDWLSLARLLLWFGWPAWPLALWTLWRWRQQIFSRPGQRHLLVPLWFTLVSIGATITTQPADRALLLGLPPLAALAAFALPTLRRSVGALMKLVHAAVLHRLGHRDLGDLDRYADRGACQARRQRGRRRPGLCPSFSVLALLVAVAATVGWCGLAWWRASRNRAPIWKSLVLPAGGAAPGLAFADDPVAAPAGLRAQLRSAGAQCDHRPAGPEPGCIQTVGLNRAQVAALQFHGQLSLQRAGLEDEMPVASGGQRLLARVRARGPR